MKTMNKILTIGALGLSLNSIEAKADLFKCLPCPDGMICDGTNKSSCPAGYSCKGGSKSQCPAGTYSPEGNSNCLPCPEGQYQPNAGQSSCSACPNNVNDKAIFVLTSINPNLTIEQISAKSCGSDSDILLAIGSNSNISNYVNNKIITPFLNYDGTSRGYTFTFRNDPNNPKNLSNSYCRGDLKIEPGKVYAICRLKQSIDYSESGCGSDGWCIDDFSISGAYPKECVRVFTATTKIENEGGFHPNKKNGCTNEYDSASYSTTYTCNDVINHNPRVSCDKKTGKFMITNDLGDVVYDNDDGLHKNYLDSGDYISGYNDWDNYIGYEEI